MTKILGAAMMVLMTLVILMTWNSASVSCQTNDEFQVFKLANLERTKIGLRPLFWNNTLYSVAKAYTNLMASKFILSHVSPVDGSSPWDRVEAAGYQFMTVGENIAAGQTTPAAVMTAWMNSPGHKANILNPDYTEFAAAVATSKQGLLFWSQLFGSKFPECGNGFVDVIWGETCDDGNQKSGDGCSGQCQVERGYTCSTDRNMLVSVSKCSPSSAKRKSNNGARWPANPLIKKFLEQLLDEEDEEGEESDLFEELSSAKGSRLGAPLAPVRRSRPNGRLSAAVDELDEFDGEEYDEGNDEEEVLMRQVIALGRRFLARDDQRRRALDARGRF